MKKIDGHAHIFDHIGSMGKAGELRPLGNGNCRWATGEEFRIIPEGYGDKEFLGETLLRVMDENGIEKAVLLQGVLYGLQNEYAMEVAAKYPDRFKAAVMLDPFCRCAQQILDRFIGELGAKVFKFEVSVGGGLSGYHADFSLDGPVMMPLYEKIAQVEDATLVLDIGSPSMSSCQPEAVARLAERFPDLNVVVCHLLAPSPSDRHNLECALPYLAHDNVWVDLSALPWNVAPEAYPYPTALVHRAGQARARHQEDRLGHRRALRHDQVRLRRPLHLHHAVRRVHPGGARGRVLQQRGRGVLPLGRSCDGGYLRRASGPSSARVVCAPASSNM